MNGKQIFIRGTLILTITSILSRFMGFFYRIFLANTIGAEGMGIYQLIFPIYSVCHAFSSAGIETAISKFTAAKTAVGKSSEATDFLKTGLFLSLILSACCSLFVFFQADFLSIRFLNEPRCTILLKALAVTIPLGNMHCCICGYYYGLKKTGVPSISLLLEQTVRIASVYLLCKMITQKGLSIGPLPAVLGLIFGEIASLLFTATCFFSRYETSFRQSTFLNSSVMREISSVAAPLTANRLIITLLSSFEAAMIPLTLKAYGMEHSAALSLYGILNGMALPFILFPNTLSGSISTMLLPTVSESQAAGKTAALKKTIRTAFSFCIVLGIFSGIFFLLYGRFLGLFFFSNELAGNLITTLAWICPFLYLNTTISSVLNGLGLTHTTFFNNMCGLLVRILFVLFAIPQVGIRGYLWGLLTSQLLLALLGVRSLKRHLHTS
ncbi:MAG: oligosaccharide flippase family protein [Lachnospiraceae bacterium]